jgi:hypothetical protein
MKSRLKAAGIHATFSVLVAAICTALVFLVWYPTPLDGSLGVGRVFLLMIAVDVVLGPLLTLVVYKAGKKSLKLDLVVIILIQSSALAYGIHSVWVARPAFVVFNVDRFDVVQAMDIDPASLRRAVFPFNSKPVWGPVWVYAVQPADAKIRGDIALAAALGGPDLPHRPEFFLPISEAKLAIVNRARPISEFVKFNPDAQAHVADLEKKVSGAALAYLPLRARHLDAAVVVNGTTGDVIDVVAGRPWAD